MQLLAPPALGVDCRVAVTYPSAEQGNLYAVLWSGPFAGAVPFLVPGFATFGLLRLDSGQLQIGATGAFDASGTAAVALPVPDDVALLGFAFDLQSVDLDLASLSLHFADNDLALTVAGLRQDWEAIFAHTVGGHDSFRAVVANAAGVYVTGSSVGYRSWSPFNPYSYEITTHRYAVDGALLWQQRYDSAGAGFDDTGVDLAVAANGDLVVLGQGPGASGDQDVVLLRYDAQGAQQWVVRWNHTWSDAAADLAISGDGSIYVLAQAYNGGAVGDITLLKFAADGLLQWERYFHGGYGTDVGVGLAFDSHGNIDIGGYSVGPGVGTNLDWVALEYDPSGTLLWSQRLVGSPTLPDYCWGMTVDVFDRVLLTGSLANTGYSLAAFDDVGVHLWTTPLGMPGGAPYSEVRSDTSGNVFCASNSSVVAVNAAGAVSWQRTVLGQARAIELDAAGQLFVTSSAMVAGANTQFVLSAFTVDGASLGARVVGDPLVDEFAVRGLAVAAGAVYAVGTTQNAARSTDGFLTRMVLVR